jgi:hypothetical protein
MRISPSQTFAGVGAFAGLVLIIAIAFVQPSHAAPAAAKACPPPAKAHAAGGHVRRTHAAGHAHRSGLMRAHAWRGHGGGHYGYAGRAGGHGRRSEHYRGGMDHWAGAHQWMGERQWSDERDFGEAHHWREGGSAWGASWVERPWATDQFGYLTWPGKSHFGSPEPGHSPHYDGGWSQGAEGAAPPPPPPGAYGPDADPEDGAYIIRRF